MTSPNINYRSLAEGNPFRELNDDHDIEAGEDADSVIRNARTAHTDDPHNNDDDDDHDHEHEETPRNSGIMIHIVPETSKARWNHIEDLDSFFTRMYNYQQKHGFSVILLDEIFQVVEFTFVIWLFTFSAHCIRHDVLFGDTPTPGMKTTLSDVIVPMAECVTDFGGLTYFILALATIYLAFRIFKMIYHITQYGDIKKFYNAALHIEDSELDNITWHEVQQRIRKVQAEQHMCIDKEQLTELDIYHRILRFKNYLVALMNKQLLPVRFNIPILGEFVSLSRGLLFNIEIILFRGPSSPFQNNWQLRDEFTVRGNQAELAQRLSKLILAVGLINLVLSPIIFVWQLIYISFSYANILRREPSALGLRTWSNYGRLYLRHFNELDHEVDARLNRAYEYADRYLSSFSSPLMAVIARNLLFISGGMLLMILAYGIYEEHVFQVEHVLTIITGLTIIGLICRTLIPDENMIWCPEQLMTAILAHVHYLPSEWKQQAHTLHVQKEFSYFFQFRAAYLLNEIVSPFVTPFVLIFMFRPKALEIVKFFRSFTVSVRGVGNVCSFAQMDVRKHGNPDWQVNNNNSSTGGVGVGGGVAAAMAAGMTAGMTGDDFNMQKPREAMADGKTEMSLVRFTLNNPEWQMPKDAAGYIKGIREHAINDLVKAKTTELAQGQQENPLTQSLMSFGTIGEEYCSIANLVFGAQLSPEQVDLSQSMRAAGGHINDLTGSAMSDDGVVGAAGVHGHAHDRAHAGAAAHVANSDFRHMLQQNLGDPMSLSSMQTSTARLMPTSVGPLDSMRRLRLSRAEGRIEGPKETLLYSLYGMDPKLVKNPIGVTVADMCLSALYLHEISQQKRRTRRAHAANIGEEVDEPGPSGGCYRPTPSTPPAMSSSSSSGAARNTIITSKAAENTPLLGNIRS